MTKPSKNCPLAQKRVRKKMTSRSRIKRYKPGRDQNVTALLGIASECLEETHHELQEMIVDMRSRLDKLERDG